MVHTQQIVFVISSGPLLYTKRWYLVLDIGGLNLWCAHYMYLSHSYYGKHVTVLQEVHVTSNCGDFMYLLASFSPLTRMVASRSQGPGLLFTSRARSVQRGQPVIAVLNERISMLCSFRALADVMRPQGHCNPDHMERDLNIVVHVQHYENMDTRTPINNLRK